MNPYVELANKETAAVASMKDWKIRNRRNRRLRELARQAVASGKLPILTQEAAEQLEDPAKKEVYITVSNPDGTTRQERANKDLSIWGFTWDPESKRIGLYAVCQLLCP